jgi:hypothetical protein
LKESRHGSCGNWPARGIPMLVAEAKIMTDGLVGLASQRSARLNREV